VHNLPAADISVVGLGIHWHIHRMDITLRSGGSMNAMPHARPPWDALILVLSQFYNKTGARTSGYRKVMVCLDNASNTSFFHLKSQNPQ
jgi:hypothetical protein